MRFKANKLNWTIEYADEDHISMNDEGGIYFGRAVYLEQKIFIRTGMSTELTRETVIHELVHCFLFSYGIKGTEKYSEEQMCVFIGAHADSIIEITDKFIGGGVC